MVPGRSQAALVVGLALLGVLMSSRPCEGFIPRASGVARRDFVGPHSAAAGGGGPKEEYWAPVLPKDAIDGLWKGRDPLLRLGKKGAQASHLNSLRELLQAHGVVRVKVNGPAPDGLVAMAEGVVAPRGEDSKPLGVVLKVSGKEFMVAKESFIESQAKGSGDSAAI